MLDRAARFVIGNAAAGLDRAATLAAYAGTVAARRNNRSERLLHDERVQLLGALRELYRPLAASFFRAPRAIEPSARIVREDEQGRVLDLAWLSEYQTALPDVAERYLRHRENRHAGTRLFTGPEPRPVAILIHGYLGGQYAAEQRVFPVEWLRKKGLDVALFTLPFHGVRAVAARRGAPPFPSSDPRISNEGFRQAMADLADLVLWLRRRGHPSVGIMGMSLGGYSTSLAATVVEDLAFAVPIIPLASLADFARDQGRLGSTPREKSEQHAALDEVHRIVSPLHRASLVAPGRMLIVAAENDRITPISHARRLSRHFDAPVDTMPGGHLLQYGRGDAFRRIGGFLDGLGLTTRGR